MLQTEEAVVTDDLGGGPESPVIEAGPGKEPVEAEPSDESLDRIAEAMRGVESDEGDDDSPAGDAEGGDDKGKPAGEAPKKSAPASPPRAKRGADDEFVLDPALAHAAQRAKLSEADLRAMPKQVRETVLKSFKRAFDDNSSLASRVGPKKQPPAADDTDATRGDPTGKEPKQQRIAIQPPDELEKVFSNEFGESVGKQLRKLVFEPQAAIAAQLESLLEEREAGQRATAQTQATTKATTLNDFLDKSGGDAVYGKTFDEGTEAQQAERIKIAKRAYGLMQVGSAESWEEAIGLAHSATHPELHSSRDGIRKKIEKRAAATTPRPRDSQTGQYEAPKTRQESGIDRIVNAMVDAGLSDDDD